ncbi:MAG: MgtC/SapB family protein [Tissierellales bacterium]
MLSIKDVAIRLIISVVLSGIIGIERESIKRPAGLRTHILVCVGSTLVMLTSIYIFDSFNGMTSLQPDRLGAQVISGIGFLGAGTIIRQGDTVRGLTTAASLWAVACIGIAVGAGFYIGAIISVLLVLVTLLSFTKLEKRIKARRNYLNLKITSINKPGQLGKICKIIGDLGGHILNIEIVPEDDQIEIVNLIIKIPNIPLKNELIDKLNNEDGVLNVLNRS